LHAKLSPLSTHISTVPRVGGLPSIPALTGLRFFAAFLILFAHAFDWIARFTDTNWRGYFSFVAMYGMPLFFVLSGFVIHYNYRRLFQSQTIARATCEFAAARFARLFPLYFCVLLMAIVADDFVREMYNQFDTFWKILAYDFTLTQSWWYIVYDNQSIISWLFGLAWSISTEMFFYAAYVAIVSNATKFVKRVCDGQDQCRFRVDASRLGDPAGGCGKDFFIEYRCTITEIKRSGFVAGEANGKDLTLSCRSHHDRPTTTHATSD
jgi:hypothetical protein